MSRVIGASIAFGCLLFLALMQVALGTSVFLAGAVLLSSLIFLPAVFNTRKDGADIVLFGLAFYLAIGGLLFKTLAGQRLETNLLAPQLTATALVLASLSILGGYFLSRAVVSGRGDVLNLARFFRNPATVGSLVMPLTLVSCGIYLLHIYLSKGGDADTPGQQKGFGGFGSFYFLVNISLAFLYAHLANYRKRGTWKGIAAVGTFLLLCSLLSNEKRPVIDFGIVTLVSFIFIDRLRPRLWVLITSAVVALPLLLMLSGAIEATRMAGKNLPPLERVELTWSLLADNNFNVSRIMEASGSAATGYSYTYRPNMSYYYPSTMNVDRYSLIFPLDQVARHDPSRIPMSVAAQEVVETLPSIIASKTGIAFVDRLAWYYGIRAHGSVGRPVIGIPGSAFAVGGLMGVALLPGLCFFLVFSASRLLGGDLRNSPLAIGLSTVFLITVEWDFMRLFVFFLRPLWLIVIGVMVLGMITLRLPAYRKWRAARVALSMSSGRPSS